MAKPVPSMSKTVMVKQVSSVYHGEKYQNRSNFTLSSFKRHSVKQATNIKTELTG